MLAPRTSATRPLLLMLTTFVIAADSTAQAADKRWNNIFGGPFNLSSNWSGGVPGSMDIAEFGLSNFFTQRTYTVSFTGPLLPPITNLALDIEDDFVTFDLNGHTYTTTTFLDNKIGSVAGAPGRLTITDGTWDFGTGVHDQVFVGAAAGASGVLTVSTGGHILGEAVLNLGVAFNPSDAGPGTLNVQNGGSVNAFDIRVGSSAPGTLNIASGGTVHVDTKDSGFIMRIGGGMTGISGTANVDGANSTLMHSGDLQVGSSGPGALNITGGGFVQSENGIVAPHGTVTISGADSRWKNLGNLDIGQSIFGQKTLRLIDGGQVQAMSILVRQGSEVRGVGTISGNVENGGLVAPGNSAGTLDINGNYTQTAVGDLAIEIAAPTEFDRLEITGTATLGGELQVSLLDGFTPSAGQSYGFFFASGGFGETFARLNLPDLPAGLGWQLNPGGTTIFLNVVTVLSGDYNQNGVVDAADYVVWRNTRGQAGAGLAADGNDNGQIENGDYIVWRSNFGRTAGSAAVLHSAEPLSAAVPEPTAAMLLGLSIAALFLIHRPGGEAMREGRSRRE